MENGYEILWTDHALNELSITYKYLENNFTKKELKDLSIEIDNTLNLIVKNPLLFPISEFKGIQRVVIKKFNTMYYRRKQNRIEILSFFSNRQNPSRIKT